MRRGAGFTLLELLVALSIFALISVMAYGGMNSVLAQRAGTEQQAERLKYLQLAVNVMARDFEQAAHRPIRDAFGDSRPALVGGQGVEGVEFTRAGRANPAGLPRATLQRVAYVRDAEDRLLRRAWAVLDQAQDSRASESVLIEDVLGLEIRFLDEQGAWQRQWPPASAGIGAQAPDPAALPRAVELVAETETLGRLRWLFRLPDNPVRSQQEGGQAPGGGGAGGNGGQPGGGAS